uniref:Sigma70_r1_2 domain-containing protein n=1 Tax=Caenorhabditis tropicalis TaxID=1561998 RepID=A0A1I7T0E9_9PELO
MSQEDESFLMSGEIEDDLVMEIEEPSSPSTSFVLGPDEIKEEMDLVLSTPWYQLSPEQVEIIHRFLERSGNRVVTMDEMRRSLERSIIELAMVRRRNSQIAPQH